MKRILLVLTLVLALTVVSVSVGCASSSDESKIKSTVNKFIDALNDGDFDEIFKYVAGADQMTDAQKQAIQQGLQIYKQMAGTNKITVKSIDDLEVNGNNATAKVVLSLGGQDSDPTQLAFVKEDGTWKLSASGFGG
ncbi:MAG: DUF4878 domain-containing protein [Dehalococcoidia bacterium]|nr:DUF4878 domain-containing protein [Dehalococcoidia bacterium]